MENEAQSGYVICSQSKRKNYDCSLHPTGLPRVHTLRTQCHTSCHQCHTSGRSLSRKGMLNLCTVHQSVNIWNEHSLQKTYQHHEFIQRRLLVHRVLKMIVLHKHGIFSLEKKKKKENDDYLNRSKKLAPSFRLNIFFCFSVLQE